jgi:hypothetical protein
MAACDLNEFSNVDDKIAMLTESDPTHDNHDRYTNRTSFSLNWTIGMNPNVRLLNLSISGKTRYFYTVGNAGVIGTASGKAQKLLQGHVSSIVSAAISNDKRWLVTSESKPHIYLIVWNTYTMKPMKYMTSTDYTSLLRVSMLRDGKLIGILTDLPNQTILLWRWWTKDASPMIVAKIPIVCEQQTWFTSIDDRSVFCSIGKDSVIFYSRLIDNGRDCFVHMFIFEEICKESQHAQIEIHRDIQKQLGQSVSHFIFCYMIPGRHEIVVITCTGKRSRL